MMERRRKREKNEGGGLREEVLGRGRGDMCDRSGMWGEQLDGGRNRGR